MLALAPQDVLLDTKWFLLPSHPWMKYFARETITVDKCEELELSLLAKHAFVS